MVFLLFGCRGINPGPHTCKGAVYHWVTLPLSLKHENWSSNPHNPAWQQLGRQRQGSLGKLASYDTGISEICSSRDYYIKWRVTKKDNDAKFEPPHMCTYMYTHMYVIPHTCAYTHFLKGVHQENKNLVSIMSKNQGYTGKEKKKSPSLC